MNRREFVASIAAAGIGSSLAFASQKKELFEISLAQWSLHKAIFGKKMDAGDFPKVAKDEFGITAVEYVNQFYKDKKKDDGYVKELRKKCDDLNVKSVLIMCDGEGQLGDADEKKRKLAVENHYRWVEWAKTLGCHSIRVNAGSSGSYEEQMNRASDGLRMLSEWAGKMQINVIVENHGGLSSNGAWLAATIKKVGHPGCGTLPDFGNFRVSKDEEYDRYKGVSELMPYAKGVSAKTHDFDAKGNETKTDYRKMMKIVMDANYHGFVGIEYEGSKLSEADGIRATKKLLETVRAEFAS
ncbi:MAG: sugar phosphate isomerase/epimerase [Planctomycetes bacterium]|nr:sugar phosphate isomerase/epimerase [Planctomycetota bacterium]NBY03276.1 sugar phosphate isomerase/epimerase [Planctomycetota bacterium]